MFEENKAITRRFVQECWNKGKLDCLEDLVSPDCRLHDPVFPSLGPGVESLERHIRMCRNAFPDLTFTIDDIIAERDEVVIHWTASGTQEGKFLGVLPTNRMAAVSGTSIYKIKNGRICEQWTEWNLLTLLEQLGGTSAVKAAVATAG